MDWVVRVIGLIVVIKINVLVIREFVGNLNQLLWYLDSPEYQNHLHTNQHNDLG